MKRLAYAIIGLALALVTLSLGGSANYILIAALYAACLLWLFNEGQPVIIWSLLIGIVVGLELLTDQHFGLYALFCFLLWLLDTAFRVRLRFTSASIRYSAALALLLLSYHLIFSSSEAASTWIPLLCLYGIFLFLRIVRQQANPEQFYAIN